MRICKACGAENRDEAKFCRGCGSPLPQVKAPARDLKKEQEVKRFWSMFMAGVLAFIVIALLTKGKLDEINKKNTVTKYASLYEKADDMAFGTVKPASFFLQSLFWNMNTAEIKAVYPYATESKDPDFESSMTVLQGEYKVPVPHADFMSLGIYNGKLYAVKFEFGAQEVFEAQQVKIPNKDEIMYGRFKGLYSVFNRLYGKPAFEKNEAKKVAVLDAIKMVKSGRTKSGAPSNVYVYWDVGDTRVELVFFGTGKKVHLTVRFLYMPVWKIAGQ